MGRKWSVWAVAVLAVVLLAGAIVEIAIPAYQDHQRRALEAAAAKEADAAKEAELENTGLVDLSGPAKVGDDYWVYINGQIRNAPPHEYKWSVGYQLQPGKYTVEVAFLLDEYHEFPFAIIRKDIDVTRGNSIQLHFRVPAEWYVGVPARVRWDFCGYDGKPDVQDLKRDMDHFESDPIVRALLEVSTLPQSEDIVVLDLPAAQGGAREFDRAQIRYVAKSVLVNYEESGRADEIASCKQSHPEFSHSYDALDGLLSDYENQLQTFHTLAGN
jgi:hypothetical protein